MVRLFFVLLLYSISVINIEANTLKFLHEENVVVKLKDPVHPDALAIAPKFKYPNATIFQLAETHFPFYLVSVKSEEYYLWMEDFSDNIEIDLSTPEKSSKNYILITKSSWLSDTLELNDPVLENLRQVDLYFTHALDSLKNLAQTNDQFRAEKNYNTIVWDGRSAKRLYNLAVEKFSYQFEENLIHYIPSYSQYWQFMYKLYYQYFHINSFKGLKKNEIESKIEADFNDPESRVLTFHYFFREGLSLNELKENYELLKGNLTFREKNLAEAFIQQQAIKDLSSNNSVDFLFGIDIDGAMEGYFARDSSRRKNILIFWSTWDSKMTTEFNLLDDLKDRFKKDYNFIHICIDAYETPEKTKSFIYQNRVGGFHLLPEQSNAFRTSNYRKALKIRDFPFYVLTDNSGKVIETESISLQISNRLENKLTQFGTKK
jgi:hypothetical protein